jgi:hypothetical protein
MTIQSHQKRRRTRARGGFTLPEAMVSATLCMVVMAGLITIYLFGLGLFGFTKPKLCASDDARAFVGAIVNELRSAHLIRIGTGGAEAFTEVGPGKRQEGNAIQIHPTADLTRFVRYYHDASDFELKRLASELPSVHTVAHSVSNHVVFSSEDFAGRVLTNNQNNRVIGLLLQFYQIEYPVMRIQPGELYDYYQVRTKVTRRKIL